MCLFIPSSLTAPSLRLLLSHSLSLTGNMWGDIRGKACPLTVAEAALPLHILPKQRTLLSTLGWAGPQNLAALVAFKEQ